MTLFSLLLSMAAASIAHGAAETAQVKTAQACNEAIKEIATYSAGLKSDCETDVECGAHPIGVDTCTPAYVFRKDVDLIHDDYLHKLQAELKKICAPLWAKRAACPQIEVKPVCRDKRCVDAKPARHRE